MPRKTPPITVNFKDEKERGKVTKAATEVGLSESNYFRKLVGLPPLKHGGSRKQGRKKEGE